MMTLSADNRPPVARRLLHDRDGTCGFTAQGTATANGLSVPVNLHYCVSGIAAGSGTSGNTWLNQELNGQQGVSGAADLRYTFSPSSAAGVLAIVMQ